MNRRRLLPLVCGLAVLSALSSAQSASVASASRPPVNVAAFRGLGHLAFAWQGRPYVLDGTQGTLWALPQGASLFADAWSRDGQWLAYSLAGHLWLRHGDGSGARAVSGLAGQVQGGYWLPGADLLAVVIGSPAQGAQDLWLVAPKGRPRKLAAAGLLSPDGAVVASATLSPYRDATARTETLSTVPAMGGRPTRQLPGQQAGIILVRWWPDSNGLVYSLDPGFSASMAEDGLPLYSLKLGGQPRRLVTTLGYRDFLSFSPSGWQALVVAGPWRTVWNNKYLAVCDLRIGSCHALPRHSGTVSLDVAWSPHGDRIAFVQARDMGNIGGFGSMTRLMAWVRTRTLWVADSHAVGAHELRAAGSGIYAPQWAGDGRHLLYLRDNALWLTDSAGGAPVRLLGPFSQKPDLFGFYRHVSCPITYAWSRR